MTYQVRLTREAAADLERLFDFVLHRELERDGGDLTLAGRAVYAIRKGFASLQTSPFSCRKVGQGPFRATWSMDRAPRAVPTMPRAAFVESQSPLTRSTLRGEPRG